MSSILKLESDETSMRRIDLDTVGAVETGNDSLPEIFLAVLGSTDRLEHIIELGHATRNHTECITSAAYNADKVVVVGRSNVM